ncbi:MAG TPA: hypothetical protein VGA80_09750, partial [Flavobacteriaceae bacterium]
MKKLLSINYSLLLFLFITLLSSCENESNNGSRLLDFAPNDTSIFINSNSFENLSLAIEHNTFLNETSNYEQLKMLEQRLQILKHLKIDSEFLICLSKTNGDSLNFTFITKAKKGLL